MLYSKTLLKVMSGLVFASAQILHCRPAQHSAMYHQVVLHLQIIRVRMRQLIGPPPFVLVKKTSPSVATDSKSFHDLLD